jgi:hypothetical protein
MSRSARLATLCTLAAALGLPACRGSLVHPSPAPEALEPAPYPLSRAITAVNWNFSAAGPRRARGSDLWPCTWAADDATYCAWGDGGGFDGNDDHVGRASLGFARVRGKPAKDGSLDFFGKNVWGSPPYAENPATVGGKVVSLIAFDGVIYAAGNLWTAQNTDNPVLRSESGPLRTLLWSADLGRSWTVAPWSSPAPLGTFLNFGRDNAGAIDGYVYIYYAREGDSTRLYLKRVRKEDLQSDPSAPGLYQFLTGADSRGRVQGWSTQESDAQAIFADANGVDAPQVAYDAKLRRYLMTAGHYRRGLAGQSSIGQVGIFEAAHPWGPWSTVGYYDDWGRLGRSGSGDFLGLVLPTMWMSADGRTLWCVYSGLREFDAFNVVKATLTTSWLHALRFRSGP